MLPGPDTTNLFTSRDLVSNVVRAIERRLHEVLVLVRYAVVRGAAEKKHEFVRGCVT